MTTVDEARAALLDAWQHGHVAADGDAAAFIAIFEAAVRAEYPYPRSATLQQALSRSIEAAYQRGRAESAEALLAAKALGIVEGRAESAKTLRALREAVAFLLSVVASGERLTEEEVARIRALAANPAEDARSAIRDAEWTMEKLLPVVLALRAWRDADGSKPRAVAKAQNDVLTAFGIFEDFVAERDATPAEDGEGRP